MGNHISTSAKLKGELIRRNSKRKARIVMMGIDYSGKTTILYKLKLGSVVTTIPTLGYNVESFEYKEINWTLWDVGPFKQHWRHYYDGTRGIIFVVDSADAPRMGESREGLEYIISSNQLVGVPLLVFANKQDFDGALDADDIKDLLGMKTITNGPFHVQTCCGVSGEGLYEGLDWLAENMPQ